MGILDAGEVASRLSRLNGWQIEDGALVRLFTFAGFADAMAFLVRVGFAAEAADHHPDIRVSYKKVTLAYVTHSEGGLTVKDFDGATAATQLAGAMGGR